MSIFGKILAAGETDISDFRNPRLWLQEAILGARTAAGEFVSPERALGLSAYYHAIRSISEDVGKMPLITYRRLKPKGKVEATDHPTHKILLESPNPNMTAQAFKETLTAHALGLGNGYAEIQWERTGSRERVVKALWPIHPSRIEIRNATDFAGDKMLEYIVHGDRSETRVVIPQSRMLHVHGLALEGVKGLSVFRMAAQSIGLGLAVETFGATFFGNGTHLRGAVKHPAKLSDKAYDHLRESWAETYQGAANAHKFAIFEEGMEWIKLGVEPEAAQFLQTRSFNVEEMARWFRMPIQKMGLLVQAGAGGQKMSDEDVQSLYTTDTLLPWMVRWEQEVQRKLFLEHGEGGLDQDHFAAFLVSGMLRGSSEARADFHSKLFHVGALSQNDIRESEGFNPIPNGDTYYVPVNLVPDDLASTGNAGGQPAPNAPRPRQPERDQTETDRRRDESDRERDQGAPSRRQGGRSEALEALRPLFVDAFARLLRKEQNAVTRAAKKHSGDANAFLGWLEGFAESQGALALELLEAPRITLSALVGEDDPLGEPATVKRAIVELRQYASELYRQDAGSIATAWGRLQEGRDEALAAALISEYAAAWNGGER